MSFFTIRDKKSTNGPMIDEKRKQINGITKHNFFHLKKNPCTTEIIQKIKKPK